MTPPHRGDTRRVPSCQVSLQVEDEYHDLVSEARLKSVVEETLIAGGRAADTAVTVAIAGDGLVRDLNRLHRGLDETTDVLSFSFDHHGQYYGDEEPQNGPEVDPEFVLPPEVPATLGDVIISYPQAQREADEAGHSVEQELAVLLAHGVLHLMGHDHEGPEEEAAMNEVATRALAGVTTAGVMLSEA